MKNTKKVVVEIDYFDYDDHMAPIKNLFERFPNGKIDLSVHETILIEYEVPLSEAEISERIRKSEAAKLAKKKAREKKEREALEREVSQYKELKNKLEKKGLI